MRLQAAAIIPALVAVLACAKPEEQVIGTWQGSAKSWRPASGNPDLDKQFSKSDPLVMYSLAIRKDKTYTERFSPDTIEGSWILEGRNLTLTPKSINGADPSKRREEWQKMTKSLQISMPQPEGTDGPITATVAEDLKSINLPLVGSSVELKRVAP